MHKTAGRPSRAACASPTGGNQASRFVLDFVSFIPRLLNMPVPVPLCDCVYGSLSHTRTHARTHTHTHARTHTHSLSVDVRCSAARHHLRTTTRTKTRMKRMKRYGHACFSVTLQCSVCWIGCVPEGMAHHPPSSPSFSARDTHASSTALPSYRGCSLMTPRSTAATMCRRLRTLWTAWLACLTITVRRGEGRETHRESVCACVRVCVCVCVCFVFRLTSLSAGVTIR